MTNATLITGASGGIGMEFARIFAENGRSVILVARGKERLESLASELRSRCKVEAFVIPMDLTDPSAPAKLAAEVQKLNLSVDCLVNNAGFGDFGEFVKTDWKKNQEMLQVNVHALTELCWLFGKQMAARGKGQILNVASTAAFQPGPLMAVYYATKAYVLSLSEAMGEELRSQGVNVLALCPGPTESGFQGAADMKSSALVKGRKMPSSRAVAEYGYRSLVGGRRVAIHGLLNKVMVFSVRLTPRAVMTKVVKWVQRES